MEQESSRRVTQQGRTLQENPAWPKQSHPSLHTCGKTPVFPLWDYFFLNATNSAAKKNRERAMRRGETKITGNGIKSEHRAWTGQGSSFVSWIGGLGSQRGPGAWSRCHRSSQDTVCPLSFCSSSTFLQRGKNPKPPAASRLFVPSRQEE